MTANIQSWHGAAAAARRCPIRRPYVNWLQSNLAPACRRHGRLGLHLAQEIPVGAADYNVLRQPVSGEAAARDGES